MGVPQLKSAAQSCCLFLRQQTKLPQLVSPFTAESTPWQRQLTWLVTSLAAALPAAAGGFSRLEVLAEEPLAFETLGRSGSWHVQV